MELSYILADPSGNTTAFVLTPVEASLRGQVARRVMEALSAEQVGFVHNGRMDMMGGEFCGNASRCFALWQALHREDGLSLAPISGIHQETVTVSGAETPLTVTLSQDAPGVYRAAIAMPLPRRVLPLAESPLGACTLVESPGICHILLEAHTPADNDVDKARALLSALDADDSCFGLMYLSGSTLRPLVYVRDTDTLIWESSCASGSCATAAALALRQGSSLNLELHQPGGSLTAGATVENGILTGLFLDGPVTFPASGILTI